jgi:DNA-binding LacI/PurR family transcriptional regulator
VELVVDHLVERGHRRIAHLGGAGGAVAAERADGYRTAMARHGLAGEIVVQACDFSEDGGYTAATALLDGGHPVTALAAVNDLAAVGALSAAADAGLDLPAGLAVTGYDDTFLAELRQISLTSVNPDSAGMGELAARRLLERIARPDRPGVEHLVAPRLVIRASSARPIPPPQEADR